MAEIATSIASDTCDESELIRFRSSTQGLDCLHRASVDPLVNQSQCPKKDTARADCQRTAEPGHQSLVSQTRPGLCRFTDGSHQELASLQPRGIMADTAHRFALIDIVNEAVRNCRLELQRNGISVVRHFHALPIVSIDRPAVLQTISTLITSAAESVGIAGLEKGKLTLRVELQQNWVHIEFEDDGIGLARDNLASYFEIGHPSQQREHVVKLQQCARSVNELRGNLYVQSGGIGRGKTVCLQLPIQHAEGGNAQPKP